LDAGDFDVTYSTFTDMNDPDDSRTFSCAAIPPGGFNVGRWCNKTYEKATAVALSHYDRPARIRAYAQTQQVLLDDVPEVFVFWNVQSHIVKSNLHVDDGHRLLFPVQWTM
jgi:ABC-type transport system substrate-binding protein